MFHPQDAHLDAPGKPAGYYKLDGFSFRAMKTITIYTKSGCHLCELAEATIAWIHRHHGFTLRRRDICADPADFERYKHDVPVTLVDGVEIARHRLTADQLLAALGS